MINHKEIEYKTEHKILGGSSGSSSNGGGGGGGCRPGYEYIVETTYQTSYEQQCR